MTDNELPPLPRPDVKSFQYHTIRGRIEVESYSPARMHAYARAALAQRQGEPVAYADRIAFESAMAFGKGCDVWPKRGDGPRETIALYTAPAPVERQGEPVTSESIRAIPCDTQATSLPLSRGYHMGWRRALEAAASLVQAAAPATAEQPAEPAEAACWYCGGAIDQECQRPFQDVPCRRAATAPAPVAEAREITDAEMGSEDLVRVIRATGHVTWRQARDIADAIALANGRLA